MAPGDYSVSIYEMDDGSECAVTLPPTTCAPGKHGAAGDSFITQQQHPATQGEGRWPGG